MWFAVQKLHYLGREPRASWRLVARGEAEAKYPEHMPMTFSCRCGALTGRSWDATALWHVIVGAEKCAIPIGKCLGPSDACLPSAEAVRRYASWRHNLDLGETARLTKVSCSYCNQSSFDCDLYFSKNPQEILGRNTVKEKQTSWVVRCSRNSPTLPDHHADNHSHKQWTDNHRSTDSTRERR